MTCRQRFFRYLWHTVQRNLAAWTADTQSRKQRSVAIEDWNTNTLNSEFALLPINCVAPLSDQIKFLAQFVWLSNCVFRIALSSVLSI